MVSSLPIHICGAVLPCKKTRVSRSFPAVRAQCFRDEGRSSSIVDANLRVLRDRMEEVRIKERLERCCVAEQGWNYVPTYTYRRKRDEESVQFLQLIGMVGGTFGLTIFSGTFCLYIISLLVHMSL
ncbi:uncharacterized protein LOC111366464 [Olea europaea var. sylvestris]|uniref:Transmembrane n=1 Tax=Olea europaea subsp. europaea TaxID=158383 RepID=A0A8S0SPJ5_OLEEU|nr:uncharacterized protein LOC111366464 [Olea europaea var. sylvestris]CAA2994196.1 transmembrane [Olea europaea subsp. europaea]